MAPRNLANAFLNNVTPRATKLTSASPFTTDAHGVDAVPFLAVAGISPATSHLRDISLRQTWSLVSKVN
jgi:hypothetical protein